MDRPPRAGGHFGYNFALLLPLLLPLLLLLLLLLAYHSRIASSKDSS